MGVFSGPPLASAGQVARVGAEMTRRSLWGIGGFQDLIPVRPQPGPHVPVINEANALRNSAVWACLRLRADLISTLPLDVYRFAGEDRLSVPVPPVLITPGGPGVRRVEWLTSSQWDIDRSGNTVGIITERDGNGLPACIELQAISDVTVRTKKNKITSYKIAGDNYDPADIWHEKGYTVAGIPVGLSPVANAALVLGQYMSVQEFVQNWYAGGGVPRARMRNTAKKLVGQEGLIVKEAWRAAISAGEPFIHGNDWEYDLLQAQEADKSWLEGQNASVLDVARYFGCPADLIDAAVNTGTTVTYANITQRNLQFLVMHLGPAVIRREDALSTVTAAPRFVKLNTNALLRMDPQTRAAYYKAMTDARALTPDEIRHLEDMQPLTQAQIDQFLTFWPPRGSVLSGAGVEAPASAATSVPAGSGPGETPAPGPAEPVPQAEPTAPKAASNGAVARR
jgi:HK97 family phage portal protein